MTARCGGGGTVLASGIRTRERKERKLYSDDWALGDEEIEGHHTFNINDKIRTTDFNLNFIKDMTNTEFNLAYIQKNGFNWPLLFKDKKELGIVIPGKDFAINDVRLCVGSRRMLDVMDVNTQKNVEMTMKDWQRYYESQDKDKLLNVISLEFSHTKLETLVEAPSVVRQIDWVEKVWPRHLKEAQTESTNVLEDMMYPKVQKYCLMSVSGCYTDFHIDFGGTSVWYHILRGKKIFWLIPPSERNLQLYEKWVLSGKQSDIFFGDTVEKCARVELESGDTFFIPTGWIHAVYTPDDSLVFGGNFLHSFGIEKQLRVASVEDTTHVPQKFRYPFFTEMLWYLLERYVHVLLGRTHLSLPPEEQEKYDKSIEKELMLNKKKEHIHLSQYELHGLKATVMYLHSLPTSKKCVPELIKDPIALIRDVRTVVEEHRYDSSELAITNTPVLDWWDREPVKYTVKRYVSDAVVYTKKRRQSHEAPPKSSAGNKFPPNSAKIRHRRVRCKECEACTRDDCRECGFCRDMTKYGGSGTMKQTCKLKKCYQPRLAAASLCTICEMDGWMRHGTNSQPKVPPSGEINTLMECSICYKINHVTCLATLFPNDEGVVNEDLPNSWECAECVNLGFNKDYKHNRISSSRLSSAGSEANIKSPAVLSEVEDKVPKVKLEPLSDETLTLSLEEISSKNMADIKTEKCENSDPSPPQMPTWEQLQARVSYPLVKPSWVVRPAPPPNEANEEDEDEDGSGSDGQEGAGARKEPVPPTMKKTVMLEVFKMLPKNDLLVVMRVCRQWAQWANDASLWKYISLAQCTLTKYHLHGIVRRQPKTLCLDWSQTTYEQFSWLLPRLQQLDGLHCVGLSWGVLRPLISPYCPILFSLNLSFCEGVDDEILGALLKPPPFHRPGHRDTSSRLRQLTHLKIAGTMVSDVGVAAIVRSLAFLTHLDMSNCPRITEYAAELFANPSSLVSHSLTCLDLRGCHRMSPLALPSLARLPILSRLLLDPCKQIPLRAIKVWGHSNGYEFDSENIMTRIPPEKGSLDDNMTSSDEEGTAHALENSKNTTSLLGSSEKSQDDKINKEVNEKLPTETFLGLKTEKSVSELNGACTAESLEISHSPPDRKENVENNKFNKDNVNKVKLNKDDVNKDKSNKDIVKKDKSNKENAKKCKSNKDNANKDNSNKVNAKIDNDNKDKANKNNANKDKSNATKKKDAKENFTKGNIKKENASKGNIPKENASNKNATKEYITKENVTKENATNENATKENATKENTMKENATKEKDTKENATNKNATNKNATKENATKENFTKENTTKVNATKENTNKESTINENTIKESTTIENTPKESTTKENTTKENTPKEITLNENSTKKSTTKENTTKENRPTTEENSTKENRSATKENTTKESTTKENITKQITTKENTTKENTTKENTTKENATKENTTKENLSKENVIMKNSLVTDIEQNKINEKLDSKIDNTGLLEDKEGSKDDLKDDFGRMEKNKNTNVPSEDDVNSESLENDPCSTNSPAEGALSESCRRSERSNKGSKYKMNLGDKKLKDKKDSEDGMEDMPQIKEDPDIEEKGPPPKKKAVKGSPPSVFKRKLKKKIITRSKSLRAENPKSNETEGGNVKHLKEEKPLQTTVGPESQVNSRSTSSKEGRNLVRKYMTKLRKKKKPDGSSSQCKVAKTQRPDEKCVRKKQEEANPKKGNEDSPLPKKESFAPSSVPAKKRKERKGSTSSSSSCSNSPARPFISVLPINKKLKVELEPIGKLCRRRSEGQTKIPVLPPNTSTPSSTSGTPTTTAAPTPTPTDKNSNRERPERQHRSPRRLSMCQ